MKNLGVILLFVFFLSIFTLSIHFSSAVEVVQVTPTETTTTEEDGGVMGAIKTTLKNPLFWGAILICIFIVLFAVLIFFIITQVMKYWKNRNDLFFKLKEERTQLAKIQRSYPSSHWWKVEKNIPIRLVRKDADGKLKISRPFAYHRGDYTTHEGQVVIAFSFPEKKKWFLLPTTDLLIIPNKEEIVITMKKDDKMVRTVYKLPMAKELVEFREGEIFIYAESMSKVGEFHIPVIISKEGKVMDLALPTFKSLQEVVLGDFLYEQTDLYSKQSKKAMDINPNVRMQQKLGDQNQTIEASTNEDGMN